MFDLSLAELAVIGAVALVVIGPDKLPGVARTAGVLLGRARRMVAGVKAEFDRELHHAELAQLRAEIEAEAPITDVNSATPSPVATETTRAEPTPIDPPAPSRAWVDERQLDLFAAPPAPADAERDRR